MPAKAAAVIGVPSGAGACGVGQEQTPAAIRGAGLIEFLGRVGFDVSDLGDSPIVPWRPDRVTPRAQNLGDVVEMVGSTASRVAAALRDRDRTVVVLGGDCTVGIGTIAGVRAAVGEFALTYFDLHSDLNTPASARDGALDWMALAHALAIGGSESTLANAAGNAPLLNASQIVLFAHSQSDATRFERAEIERLGLARVGLEEVRDDPEAAARHALELVAARSERHVIHLDVDVVDFTDAPLSEHPSRNTGLKLDEMRRAENPRISSRLGCDHAGRAQSAQCRGRRRVAGALRSILCRGDQTPLVVKRLGLACETDKQRFCQPFRRHRLDTRKPEMVGTAGLDWTRFRRSRVPFA